HSAVLRQAVREEVQRWQDIHLIEQVLSREEIDSLLSVSDCVVSLHRSEGFGLVPAEAMSLGKPVIMTRWSGNTDYMTTDNCVGIDYHLVKVGRDIGPYSADQDWAEPDVDQAAYWMRTLRENPELASRIGQRGRETIRTNFSPQSVGEAIKQRITFIRSESRW